ncbi:TIGR04222 domain-containing membrane protein [Gloeothece verrucosa]|uniref:TIGR04222 domain-containing membrane protein n=1 Tax=Gloeothece verrucosa (strain PCC 7822) TaxID=497965 RepID=E0UMU4_GLOV7|nr:TIGR04222 domain-containing membrane protein [Gloeothece verrucosa]ADN18274.1 conserved hypothetical protein [Gloeothece verrucosa PCC 7822]
MMNESQLELYQRIQAFTLDDDTQALSFSQHLARSNRWQIGYTKRAIDEYKKFTFLAVVAGHPVCPSDQVDQVWHLHIFYTYSYWNDFCLQVLQYPLHHLPTQGGQQEREKFHHYYRMTLESYHRFFGKPPEDIWPPPSRRFGSDLHQQRINLTEFWIVPKQLPQIKISQMTRNVGMFLLLLVLVGCSPAMPARFLGFDARFKTYLILCAIALIGAYFLRWFLRTSQTESIKPQLDHYEIAYLAGGPQRAVDLAITNLVQQQYLKPKLTTRSFSILKKLPNTSYCLEQQVLSQVVLTRNLLALRQAVTPKTIFLRDRLQKYGLLMKGKQARICYLVPIFMVFGAIILGGFLITLDAENVGEYFKTIICLVLCSLPLDSPPFRSRQGDLILSELKSIYSTDIAYTFALSGSTALSGGVLDDLKQVFNPPSNNTDGGCGCGC